MATTSPNPPPTAPVVSVSRQDRRSGRLRLRVLTLYRNPDLCARVERALVNQAGVISTRAQPLTGSLLLVLDDWELARVMPRRVAELSGRRSPAAGMSRASPSDAGQRRRAPPQQHSGADWHTLSRDEVVGRLAVQVDRGLDGDEAARRLRRWGRNSLDDAQPRSALTILVGQFTSLPVALLGVSAAISIATGGVADAAVILGVAVINAAIGYVTERQAERTIAALSQGGPRFAQVMRDGERRRVALAEIVPGDVLLLTPGSYVAADARLLSTRRLSVDESALTGESLPVDKNHAGGVAPDAPLGDRDNMVHMGTLVTGGDGVGVVVETGQATELGHIQSLVDTTLAPETPMQRQLQRLGTQLGLISAAICAGVFGIGMLRGYGFQHMLKASVSLAVAAVPEGLPAVATTTLALGIREMQRHRVAVRQLGAVETLGSVRTLCLDKTGTLTRNHMSLVALYLDGSRFSTDDDGRWLDAGGAPLPLDDTLCELFRVVCLCSEADVGSDGVVSGSPTELALVEAALQAGLDVRALRAASPRLEVRPRAEDRPLVSSVHGDGQGRLVAVKGSPAAVIARCSHVLHLGQRITLDDAAREQVLQANRRMAGEALRVLGVALAQGDETRDAKARDLTWLGLVGLTDPLRRNMRQLMHSFHRAGIETVMITGDQKATALAIGHQLGLSSGRPLRVLDAQALDEVDAEQLADRIRDVHVFARVSPAHKLKIVQAMQRAGQVVAMTGDGINDGPALKAADIGIALGAGGADVARQVSDVVLQDDNLESLVAAVRHGRTIYANIRKTVHFLLATNFSEIEVMVAGVGLGLGQPLTPMQLLWINLLSDIFPGLALSMETPEPGLMQRAPRNPTEPIVRRRDLGHMLIESGTIAAGAMAAFGYGRLRYGSGAQARSLAFNTLTTGQLLHAYACRSDRGVTVGGNERNAYLDLAVGGSLGMQALSMLLPPLRRLLGTTPPGLLDLLVIGGGALAPYLVNRAAKPSGEVSPGK